MALTWWFASGLESLDDAPSGAENGGRGGREGIGRLHQGEPRQRPGGTNQWWR